MKTQKPPAVHLIKNVDFDGEGAVLYWKATGMQLNRSKDFLNCQNGSTADAYHGHASSRRRGGSRSNKLALMAGDLPGDVSYINAHGTSTLYNDKFETMAIKDVFGERIQVSCHSAKSMTGHLLGAAGGLNNSSGAIVNQFVHSTITMPSPIECDLDYVPNRGREWEMNMLFQIHLGSADNACILVRYGIAYVSQRTVFTLKSPGSILLDKWLPGNII